MRPDPLRAARLEGDPTERCARQILEVVPRAMRFLREEMRQGAGTALSIPQFRVLAYLGRSPGASLSAVARTVGVTDPTASLMVNRLVKRGLVTRAGDPAERRRVMLALTNRGAARLERARSHARARVSKRLEALDRTELSLLERGLTMLERALGPAVPVGVRP